MKKVINLIVRDLGWLKQRLATFMRYGAADSAFRPREHHGLHSSLVSHDRYLSGRLF